jgi:hypothetical protein
MRWTDLPADRGPADGGDSPVLRRGDWENLKRRLERLPAGHPSSPHDDDAADEDDGSPEAADGQDQELDRPGDREDGEREGRHDEPGSGRGGAGRRDGRGGHDAPAGPGTAGGGRREPYRPWFTSSDSPEPWFYADPPG